MSIEAISGKLIVRTTSVLPLGKSVGLLQPPYPVRPTSFTKDGDKVTEIRAIYDKEGKKPKTYIQWVPEGSRKAEVRIHNALFKSEKTENTEGGFLNDINPNSEEIWPTAMIERSDLMRSSDGLHGLKQLASQNWEREGWNLSDFKPCVLHTW
jgi:hypothetical protein